MTTTTINNGYNVYWDGDQWRYSDTDETVIDHPRPCTKCGHMKTEEDHDYCIRNLGSVVFACCGHGEREGYIKFDDGTTISQ